MANPHRAWRRLLELIQDRKEEDVNMLATFCLELERTVVSPMQARVDTLEDRVRKLEEAAGNGSPQKT